MTLERPELEYVGFWPRAWASVIDTVLMLMLVLPLAVAVFGTGYWSDGRIVKGPTGLLVEYVVPAVAVLAFWIARGATPGKMAISARIVDASTGGRPSTGQLIGRYLAYYVSALPFFLGFFWVAFDRRKQGWHDKLAGTVVVRPSKRGAEPVRFDAA